VAEKVALVTGGAGFIGSHVVRALLDAGRHVRILDNLSTGSRENLAGVERQVDLVEGDIRNAVACRTACRGVSTVFHLAAYISVPGSVQDPVTADAINIGGTLNMLLAAQGTGVRRFVLSSSAAVYGDTEVLPTPEDTLPKPLSPYGVEKLYGEHMLRLFHALHGIETVSLRYFNVYGPRQNPRSEYAAVIPKFISALLDRQAPTIFGDGSQTRDFLFVGDVARANVLAATVPGVGGEVFNVAGGRAVSVRELFDVIHGAVGARIAPIIGPERPGDILHSRADVSKARERLGFAPATDLSAGLAATVEHYREKRA
jgi:UDP-N-acetylglucosamine/UDP-N-acetylgalactosamine 4-epimerase